MHLAAEKFSKTLELTEYTLSHGACDSSRHIETTPVQKSGFLPVGNSSGAREKPCLNRFSWKSHNQETRTLIATNLPPSSRYVTSAFAPTCNSAVNRQNSCSIWKVIDFCEGSCICCPRLEIVWLGPIPAR